MEYEDFAAELEELKQRWGIPRRVDFGKIEMHPEEFQLVENSAAQGRHHDVTVFIHYQNKYVVIEKHAYAHSGILRAPSGGAKPSETLMEAARREASEETGLDIELEQLILKSHATFTSEDQPPKPWVSYVFLARAVGGQLGAKDVKEISDVQLRTREELLTKIRSLMLASGMGGFKYRALLTDAFFEELDKRNLTP